MSVLIYILLCGGSVEESVLETPLRDRTRKEEALRMLGVTDSTLRNFQTSVFHYYHFLMVYDNIERKYKFSHSSVQESLFKCLVNYYPQEIIKSCDFALLERLTTCKKLSWNSIVIVEDIFQDLIKRLLEVLQERSVTAFQTLSRLHIWEDEEFNHLIEPVLARYPQLIDVRDNEGGNALHIVAYAGDKTIFQELIQSGCEPYSTSDTGSTVLSYACQNGKLDMVKYICEKYPDLLSPDHDDKTGMTPLHWTAQSGNIELYEYLIEKGVKQTFPDGQSTPLHEACKFGRLNMCEYLVNTHPHLLDVKDNNGDNALHTAAWGGNIDLLNFLLEKGFDVKTKRNDGGTVLHLCCMNGKLEMCKYLVNAYPHLLDVKDNNGENALHDAAWGGNIDLLNFLLDNNFDVKTKRIDGKTVLHLCCMNGELEMCKYLVNAYPHLLDVNDNNGENALHDAAWGGNIDLLNLLLKKGFDVKTKRNDGKTVLHQCCINGELEMCKYLVNTHPHLLDVKDNNGDNALHTAAWGGNIDLLNFLLEKGFDIETKTNDGKTVLHQCCMNGKLEMCKYLVNTFPHLLDVKDNNGENALHEAARGDNIDLVTFLSA
ncbi:putative ankyrin repeat protein RF_0381 [Saccostrea cucullata]|uniref:putative ankyrin repeat protein RF_0381 n=1 Tax=Saccostrea cuccullata TaxID=36930 RepID=UPI002ED603DF